MDRHKARLRVLRLDVSAMAMMAGIASHFPGPPPKGHRWHSRRSDSWPPRVEDVTAIPIRQTAGGIILA